MGEDEGVRTMTRWIFVLIAALIMSGPALADEPEMRLSRLSGPLYLVEDHHFAATNSLVYVGLRYVTVIGATWTPDTARQLSEKIRDVTSLPVREVIDTSPDPEWSGGNVYWKKIGVIIVASDVTCDFLDKHWSETVADIRKSFPDYPDTPLALPTVHHRSNFELQDGAIKAFYLGPSHTDADVFVYFPREKVLDAGSILKEHLGNMAKANVVEYPNTLRKLEALHLPIRTIISGHWSAIHGPELIAQYLQMLQDRPAAHP